MYGFLNINKQLGQTSHDVVAALRRLTRIKAIGHAGTLDPAASGVLVVGIGTATRLIEYVQDDTVKEYRAVICFGSATDTDDAQGIVITQAPVPELTETLIQQLIAQFSGMIQQVPPKYSALHHNGERMHELARRGIAPELPARPVHVHSIAIESWESPLLTCRIRCGKGTYIRSLARDFGMATQSAAHLAALQRTAVGDFFIDNAITVDALQSADVHQYLFPLEHAVRGWHTIIADAQLEQTLRYGQSVVSESSEVSRAAVFDTQHRLIAIVIAKDGRWYPHKVFHQE